MARRHTIKALYDRVLRASLFWCSFRAVFFHLWRHKATHSDVVRERKACKSRFCCDVCCGLLVCVCESFWAAPRVEGSDASVDSAEHAVPARAAGKMHESLADAA